MARSDRDSTEIIVKPKPHTSRIDLMPDNASSDQLFQQILAEISNLNNSIERVNKRLTSLEKDWAVTSALNEFNEPKMTTYDTRIKALESDNIRLRTTLNVLGVIGTIILGLSSLGVWKFIGVISVLLEKGS